ncbi:lantibiotic dehydratase family protein [Streptomyces erythrochromogenes]|uniref:Lantibiotic dehydratase family protein n=1 Tax=Streptomyces erythrochromogenes TaxID=285574 RepID=A0ABZ1QKT4_9ACTN|nr:lantibiotic dehydratase [Streptomyces erythrochromogenes]MCX5588619.1 lantibiotic dehydratase family protein [Streptomyces erythrochromogenes]
METLDLALARTSDSLRRETEFEEQLAERADFLTDALHAAVPTLDDAPHLRRAVLKLRRCIHNGRPVQLSEDIMAGLRETLGGPAALALTDWLHGMRDLSALRERTDALYEEERGRATGRLREVLSDPVFAQGLAQASPHLLDHVTARPLEPNSKAARSVLGYVSRAAVKTSPFSRLTALALEGGEADGTGHSYVDQQHVRAWLDTLARDKRFAAAFQVEPNRSLRRPGGRAYLLTPAHPGPGESAWRTDSIADASRHVELIGALASWPRMTIAQALVRIGGRDPFGGFLRLLDTGLLQLVLPWTATEPHPIRSLARSLQCLSDPVARRTRALLEDLGKEAAGLHLLSGSERARSVNRLAARIGSGTADDPRPAIPYAAYEDALSDVPADLPAEAVREDLAELGRLLRPYVFRSHVYDWLRDEFVARYGAGGHCPDLFEFLWAVAASPGFEANLYRALQKDHGESGRPTERAWLPVSASSAPPTAAVLYQVAARSADAVRSGDYRIVVNQYNSGVGGLLARFRHQLDGPTADRVGLTRHLRHWIAELFPHAAPRQLTLSGDVNGMHRAADGVLPAFRWPGEPSHAGEAVHEAAPATISHCPDTDTLEFADGTGRALAPVYLGVVPQHLIPGVARLLLCLADPWINGSRLCCTPNPVDGSPPVTGEDVEVVPRRVHDRLVLGRRTWRIAPEALPQPTKGEQPSAYFRRVHRWRIGLGLPDEAFVSVEFPFTAAGVSSSRSKPFWLSFQSPHAIWAAANHIGKAKDATAVRLAETCPDRSAYWLRDDSGSRRAAEHVSLLRWQRPSRHARPNGEPETHSAEASS